jgi:hypothetical protein
MRVSNVASSTETELKDAAWYYPTPMEKAKHIKDYVAFCKYTSLRVCVHHKQKLTVSDQISIWWTLPRRIEECKVTP